MLTQVAKVTKRALGGATAKTAGSTLKKVKKEKHVEANEVVVEGEEKESLSLRLARTLAEADELPPVCSPGQPDWRVADGLRHLMGGPDGEAWAEAIGRLGIPRKVVARCGKASATGEEAPLGIFRDTLSFESLAKVIIYQQLHGAACEKIFARTRDALGGDLSTRAVLGAVAAWGPVPGSSDRKDKQLVNGKPSGLSRNKWKYLTSLAEHFSDPAKLQGVKLQELDDAELKKKLVAVTGLGTWSVEMFQIFKLSRQVRESRCGDAVWYSICAVFLA